MEINKRVTVILEFGIPPYRNFLLEYVNSITKQFTVLHNGEKFPTKITSYKNIRCKSVQVWKFKFYLGVNRYLKSSDVIITSFNFWRPSCWIPILFFKGKKILWGHIRGSRDNFISKFFKRLCISKSTFVLAYTQKGKDYAIKSLKVDPQKIIVVKNTLHVSNFQYSQSDRSYFLYVGRIQERKSLADIIYAIKNLHQDGELLRVVGDGDYKAELRTLVAKLGLNKQVTFHEGTYDEEILRGHFSSALAYVSPSQIGLGAVHSFAYGIPVLVDKLESHGPEFEYCNEKNSYFYYGKTKLTEMLNEILLNKSHSFLKGKEAFNYYNSNLKVEYMKNAFYNAIYK